MNVMYVAWKLTGKKDKAMIEEFGAKVIETRPQAGNAGLGSSVGGDKLFSLETKTAPRRSFSCGEITGAKAKSGMALASCSSAYDQNWCFINVIKEIKVSEPNSLYGFESP
jgi:hypothetical protein